MIFTDVITLYNYHKDPTTKIVSWQRTVIKNVKWHKATDKTISTDGKIMLSDRMDLTIPYYSVNKVYLNPKDYLKTSSINISNYFTLNPINNLDVFILGEINQEVTTNYTITNLKNDYYYVATISAVTDNTNRDELKHWKVLGK